MSWDRMELKNVDYGYWNYVVFVTLNEFIYLGAGYEPRRFNSEVQQWN